MPPSKPISEVAVDFNRLSLRVTYDQLKDLAKESTLIIQREAESIARGSIRQSFRMKIERGSNIASVEVKMGPDKKHWYARFFETGTRAHEIRAHQAKALFSSKTNQFFGRTVQHPGMKSDPILSRAVATAGPEASKHFAEGIRRIILDSFAE